MSINFERLREYPVVAIDTETTGLHWYTDKMFGVAIATYDGDRIESAYWDVREKPRILEALRAEAPHLKKVVNHKMKFDAHMLMNERIMIPLDRIECTEVRAALINEHEILEGDGFNLDALCKRYIGEGKVDIWNELAQLFGGIPSRAVQIKNLHRAPSKLAAKYAAPDPALALKLWLWQEKEIESQQLQKIWDLERRLTGMLVRVERQGIRVDEALAEKQEVLLKVRMDEAQRALDRAAGKPVNANSAPQMRTLFGVKESTLEDGRKEWRTDKGILLETTDGGVASIDKDALMVMAELGDDRAKQITALRKLDRGGIFLRNHIRGHAHKGRVYPNYNQTRGDTGKGTGTGRFSIDDPAMQQIPMHDRDVAEIVRPCFLPEQGHDWGCADWKQFEFRWFAHYVKDPKITKMYEDNPNADFHQTTADITGITRDRKYAGDTANAKQINLGLVFGMGEGEMAYNMGMEYTIRVQKDRDGKIIRVWKIAGEKAKQIFNTYHDAIPGVKKLLNEASSIARKRGYVQTAMGRRIRFPGGKFLHKAAGLVFQGTSADCIKLKMLELDPICQKEGWLYMLCVHDEHDLSIPRAKTAKAKPVITDVLQTFDGERSPVKCRIPILTDLNFGSNWWEACK